MPRVIELITPAQDVLETSVLEHLPTSGRKRVVFGRGQLAHGSAADVAVLEHWFADTDSMGRALARSWVVPVAGQHWFERIVVRSEHVVWPRGSALPTWSDALAGVLWTIGSWLVIAGIVGLFARPIAGTGVLQSAAFVLAAAILVIDAVAQIRALEQPSWLQLCLFFVLPVLLVLYAVRPEINLLPGRPGLVAGLGFMLASNLVVRIHRGASAPNS